MRDAAPKCARNTYAASVFIGDVYSNRMLIIASGNVSTSGITILAYTYNGYEMRVSVDDNGNWKPWEWVNPPMELSVEYRTTERYLGKPVYVKAVDCGTMPNNSMKSVRHGIDKVRFMVYGHDTANQRPIPTMCLSGNFDTPIGITVDSSDIAIHTTFDATTTSAVVVVKYTKTTN